MKVTKLIPRAHKLYPQISITENGPVKEYVISIDDRIDAPHFFVYVVQVLLSAGKDDKVVIHINTNGGYVDSGLAVVAAMKRCEAPITTIISGHAYSCGAFIWAFGDERLVGKFARGMFHTSSHGGYGKTRSIKEMAEAIEKRVLVLMDEIVERGVITKEHLSFCLDNKKDLYFTSNDVEDGCIKAEVEDDD